MKKTDRNRQTMCPPDPPMVLRNLRTWAHNVRLHIAGTSEPKSAQQVKQGT